MRDLAEFIDSDFEIPYGGKVYRVPPPGAKEGLYLQAIVDAGEQLLVTAAVTRVNRKILSDDQERSVFQMALGPVYDEMLEDGVSYPILKHAGMTAVIRWTRSEELAEAYWDRGPGKAPTTETEKASPTSGATSPEAPSIPTPA